MGDGKGRKRRANVEDSPTCRRATQSAPVDFAWRVRRLRVYDEGPIHYLYTLTCSSVHLLIYLPFSIFCFPVSLSSECLVAMTLSQAGTAKRRESDFSRSEDGEWQERNRSVVVHLDRRSGQHGPAQPSWRACSLHRSAQLIWLQSL